MLVAPKSKLFNASLEFHPRMLFSTEKIHFQKLAGSNYKIIEDTLAKWTES